MGLSVPRTDGGARVCRVRPDVPALDRTFDYLVPEPMAAAVTVGTIVRVPLAGRRVRGWVVEDDVAPETDRLLPLAKVVGAGPPADVVALCEWAAWRWAGRVPNLLRAASPPNAVRGAASVATLPRSPRAAGSAPPPALLAWPPAGDRRDLVADLIAPTGSTLVIVADTSRLGALRKRLERDGHRMLELRGTEPDAARTRAWAAAREGSCVVVGGRVAVWAPVPDLAAIIVLDEGDEALQEERTPTWNGRDVAVERAAAAERDAHARRRGAHARGRGDRRPAPATGPWHRARRLADRRGRRSPGGAAGHRAADRPARDRAAPCGRSRRSCGLPAEPAGPGPAPRVRGVQRARPLRTLRRVRRGDRRRRPALRELRARAPGHLPALSRHPAQGPAPRRVAGPGGPRRAAPAGRGGRGRRVDRRALGRSGLHRHRGGAAPAAARSAGAARGVPRLRPGAARAAVPRRRAGARAAGARGAPGRPPSRGWPAAHPDPAARSRGARSRTAGRPDDRRRSRAAPARGARLPALRSAGRGAR